ncbi:hypothetical protein [Burkholderia multivorans]|uniref:Uncharacterized protein n=1 Tax=Burkholderia multivorans TaxID=87883 RepID=A0A2S9M9N6_9BURK|nr:hypothetical protein [Burkholderia multivorans]MBU9146050.1 hypothetical protein [Burkholderia multivorans]MBU9528759.1 hypothetical protein [Burkholderia multivorans]MBU9540860.1 hypothetical protein [Burkholderia multivorans]MBU9639943.1 hypothetical protein [Burkholderia multivorans]PRE98394.1 hypothetical protein C6Q07_29645 [Burkholderia multivorans]
MANPVTVMMNDGRRVEFSDAAALGRFAASRAFHLESLLHACSDDGFAAFQEMQTDARTNLLWLMQDLASEVRELTCAVSTEHAAAVAGEQREEANHG